MDTLFRAADGLYRDGAYQGAVVAAARILLDVIIESDTGSAYHGANGLRMIADHIEQKTLAAGGVDALGGSANE